MGRLIEAVHKDPGIGQLMTDTALSDLSGGLETGRRAFIFDLTFHSSSTFFLSFWKWSICHYLMQQLRWVGCNGLQEVFGVRKG